MAAEPSAGEEASRYRVVVLGPFALLRNGVPVQTSRWQQRVQTLFKLLATAPDRQRRREELIEILWPETDPETGAGNLRILVHRLRLALGGPPSPVLSTHGWVLLNPAYIWELDLDEMDELVRSASGDVNQLEEAACLYSGEPLVEDRYEDWAMPIRTRVERLWRTTCLQLSSLYRAQGNDSQAVIWYERLLETDPLDEEAAVSLLSALEHAGRPAEALRVYHNFEHRLATELDVQPSPEMTALAERIKLHLGAASAYDPPLLEMSLPVGRYLGAMPEGPFVGRVAELENILLAVDAASAGAGRLILITGEAGVGKTRLGQEVTLQLLDRHFLTVAVRCYEAENAVPFAPFMDLLSRVYAGVPMEMRAEAGRRWPQLAWLLPEGSVEDREPVVDEPDAQHALFRTAEGFLKFVAARQPLALLIDDLQWADEGSLALLHYLAHSTHGHPIFLLGAYRDADLGRDHPLMDGIREMSREGLVDRVPLMRLTPEETAAMVATLVGDLANIGEFLEFVTRRTKGNPFYIHKIVEALGGHYRLVRQIGVGGMGRVFEAVDTRSGEQVAVKLLFARTETDARALLRFRQEGAVLAVLKHPNIVRVIETIIDEHASCIVMEYVEGRSLAATLQAETLSLARIKTIAEGVLAALIAAHERGIVHRDIKPANIMVGENGHVTVTDFGIARLMHPHQEQSTMTSTGMTMGTPHYMAPEQIVDGPVDGRTDIYALGAVMYRMTTGEPPFEGDDPLSIAYKHVNEQPLPPRLLVPDLPQEWNVLILKALSKDPSERFQSAPALERAVTGLPATSAALLPVAQRQAGGVDLAPRQPLGSFRSGSRRYSPPRVSFVSLLATSIPVFILILALFLLLNGGVPILTGKASGTGALTLHGPTGIAVDSHGRVYVVDQGNDRVAVFNANGTSIARWGSSGVSTSQFIQPSDVAVSSSGNVLVTDAGNKRIEEMRDGRQFDVFHASVGSLALQGNRLYASDFGRSQIYEYEILPDLNLIGFISVPEVTVGDYPFPAGMAAGPSGTLYIADRDYNQIVKLLPSGKVVATFGRSAHLNAPSDVAVDSAGNLYIADTRNNRIVKLSPQGRVLNIWGTFGTGRGQFDGPVSIALDAAGDMYISDYYNNRIVKLSPSGKQIWSTDGQKLLR